MKRKIDIKLSKEAKLLVNRTNINVENLIDFITKDGFTLGSREVIAYLKKKDKYGVGQQ